jgi:hypothetical protein
LQIGVDRLGEPLGCGKDLSANEVISRVVRRARQRPIEPGERGVVRAALHVEHTETEHHVRVVGRNRECGFVQRARMTELTREMMCRRAFQNLSGFHHAPRVNCYFVVDLTSSRTAGPHHFDVMPSRETGCWLREGG